MELNPGTWSCQESDLPIELYHQASFYFLFILRYGFIKLSRLALNALCSPGRSRAEDIPASASQAVEITGLYYHTWLQILYGRISANTAVSQLWTEGTCNLPHNVAVAQGKCSAIANFLDSQEEISLYKTSWRYYIEITHLLLRVFLSCILLPGIIFNFKS